MNGMDEMAESLAFLRQHERQVFSGGVTWRSADGPRRLRQSRPDSRGALAEPGRSGFRRRLRCHAERAAAFAASNTASPALHRCRRPVAARRGPEAVVHRHAAPAARRAGRPGRRRPASMSWSKSRWPPAWRIATPCWQRPGQSRHPARRHQPTAFLRAGAAHEGRHRRRQDRPARLLASS